MRRTIAIHLGEEARRIATLRYNQQGARENAAFEYDPAWLADPGRFAIDPLLPLIPGPQFHPKVKEGSVFHGAIADTEPDGWGKRVIHRDHAKRRDEARREGGAVDGRPLNALDFLLAVDDVSRIGALRFQDEDGIFRRATEDGRRTAPPLVELRHLLAATRAVESNTETAADLAYLRGRGTSLGGLRPKCTVVDDEGRLSIGKFPSIRDERSVTRGEVLALRLAAMAGINAAQASIVDSEGLPIALVRRFDRPEGGGRLMYVSAATMLGVDPGDGSEQSYTDIVDALRRHGASPREDIEELWRRIAFSILITNVDDHILNHGFLHADGGHWRLSPAFDVNPFPERVRELKTWISEETGPAASIDALMSVIPYFEMTPTRAKEILAAVEGAVARWRDVGGDLGMNDVDIGQFAEAFEHDERSAARRQL